MTSISSELSPGKVIRFSENVTLHTFDVPKNPLIDTLNFETNGELNNFFRISLTNVNGTYPGSTCFHPSIHGARWSKVIEIAKSEGWASDIPNLVAELWPWIVNRRGFWVLDDFELLANLDNDI